MKNQIRIFIWAATVLFLIIGCGGTNKKTKLQGGSLENTSWILVKFPGHDVRDLDLSLNFEGEKLHGKAVCNNYFSNYITSSNKVKLEPVAATRKMCASDTQLEIEYFNLLSKADQYGIMGDTLQLKTPQGLLKFAKMTKVDKLLVLKEDTLGDLPLQNDIDSLEKGLKKLFPKEDFHRKSEELEDGTYEVLVIGSKDELLKGILSDNMEQLNSLKIVSSEIQDQYEVQIGMSFDKVKSLRPNIEIATDTHFHTYVCVPASKIKYEICCNTNGPDKNDWSIGEVNDWKVKSIIWQNN